MKRIEKNLPGQVSPLGGASGRGFSAQILYGYALFWFLKTLQPEINAKLIPKTLFRVTEMSFSKK